MVQHPGYMLLENKSLVLLFVARMLLKSTVLELTVLAVLTLRTERKKFFDVELTHVVLQ